MDWMTFVSRIVEFGAWPLLVAAIFYVIKTPILNLIDRLDTAKYKDFQVSFKQAVHDIKEILPRTDQVDLQAQPSVQSNQSSPGGIKLTSTEATLRNRLVKIADEAPRAAVLEAWLEVEHAAQRLISARGLRNRPLRAVGPQVLLGYLDKLNAVSPEQRVTFERLRELRNRVVHFAVVNLPLDSVIEYVDLALELARQMNTAAGFPSDDDN